MAQQLPQIVDDPAKQKFGCLFHKYSELKSNRPKKPPLEDNEEEIEIKPAHPTCQICEVQLKEP